MNTNQPAADRGRPTEKTPCGVLYTDTPEFALNAKLLSIRNWRKALLDDMESLRIDAKAAGGRIDAYIAAHPNESDKTRRAFLQLSMAHGHAALDLRGEQLQKVTGGPWTRRVFLEAAV